MTQFSTIISLLRHRAFYQSDHEAYTFLQNGESQAESITYQELDRRAQLIASRLQSLDAANQRVLLLYPPGIEFIAAFFGCLYAKAIAVPTHPPRRARQVSRILSISADTQAAILLTTSSVLAKVKSQLTGNPEMTTMQWLSTGEVDTTLEPNWQAPVLDSNDLAFLQYTSGSTGNLKGVMVSHSNLLHNLASINQCLGVTSKSKGVSWLPPYHDMGLVGGILQPLYAGAPMVLMSPMAFLQKPFRWLQAISNYKATISGAPDFAYDLVCRRITSEQQATLDLSCWEVAFIGAEPIRVKTLSRFAATFMPFGFRQEALYPCYGLAENTLIASGKSEATPPKACSLDETSLQRNRVAIVPEQKDAKVIVSCGQNCLDQTIKIVNPESRTVCPPNQIGEVWISGPSTAQGYWNQPVQTEVTFRAFLADTGEGPFLRTGDLGFLHNGELLITGRLKDLVIILGRNYYPQEIELTVEHSHSMLRSGCGVAFSVEITDQEKLIIAHEVEWSYLRKLNANEVFSSIRRAVVEKHDLPVYAIFLLKPASLPKTSSGKVRRIACREGFLTGSLNVVADWSANPRLKAKFLDLETDVSCLLQQLQAEKQCKIDRHLVTGFKVYAD